MNPIFSHYRNGVSFKTGAGKSKSITEEMIALWKETILPKIISCYALKDIFNADEFGLFYQTLPSISKHSKVRLTGAAAGNAFGERIPMVVT